MNRTDRLLAIVLELQARGKQRAEDLAVTFETSKRTIYRDMLALGEAGVPLVSVPGKGYALMEGYFLPPLSFTSEEATILLLGCNVMAGSFDAQYRQVAQAASRKIDGILPERLREEVRYLQEAIHFVASGTREENGTQEALRRVRRAIIERQTVRFIYHARQSSSQSEAQMRTADPYALISVSQTWYLSAYCHLRQAVRFFRLERMEALEVLPQTFTRVAEIARQTPRRSEAGNLLVRVLFDLQVTRWVREQRSFFTVSEEETPAGLLVTLKVRQVEDILQWLLGWGSHVRVLEPDTLRTRLACEAEVMLRNFQSPE